MIWVKIQGRFHWEDSMGGFVGRIHWEDSSVDTSNGIISGHREVQDDFGTFRYGRAGDSRCLMLQSNQSRRTGCLLWHNRVSDVIRDSVLPPTSTSCNSSRPRM